jgi:hypothetical protein
MANPVRPADVSAELLTQVGAARRGERGALRTLFDRFSKELVAFCVLAEPQSREQALTLAAGIFSEAFRSLTLDSDGLQFEPRLWAYAARAVRARPLEPEWKRLLEAFVLQRPGGVAALDETEEERAARLALIESWVKNVDDERAAAVARAHYLLGQDTQQVARSLGLPHGTVTLKLMRFHDRVKRELCRLAVSETPRVER